MTQTLALLCLIVAPAIIGATSSVGFKRTFGLNPFKWNETAFVDMPKTNVSAYAAGWEQKTGPSRPSGYESLDMWCPTDDNTVCILFDPYTGYVAGLQIALNMAHFNPAFDMDTLGFSNWTTTVNGTSTQYYTISQFYMSTEMLATEPASRTNIDNSSVVQNSLWLTGFNGELYNVSTNTEYITDTSTSPYTEQACIIFMGHHYYYKMSNTTECTAKTLFPWFPIINSNRLIAVGFMVFGTYSSTTYVPRQFEQPSKTAVKVIVPNGPECLYTCAGEGVFTMHIYFIENILPVLCVFEE